MCIKVLLDVPIMELSWISCKKNPLTTSKETENRKAILLKTN